MSEPRLVIRGDGGAALVREAEGAEPEVFEVPPWVIRHLAKGRWWMEVFAILAEAAAPDPVASPLNGDVLAWHDRLPHQQKGCPICEHGLIGSPDPIHSHDGGDGHCRSSCPLWNEALERVASLADDIDPVSRPVASLAPLDVARLARALSEYGAIIPASAEYVRIAAFIIARLGQPVAESPDAD